MFSISIRTAMLPVPQTMRTASYIMALLSDKLEVMWLEEVVAYFVLLSLRFSADSEQDRKKHSLDYRCKPKIQTGSLPNEISKRHSLSHFTR
jgi:hypothetical protein